MVLELPVAVVSSLRDDTCHHHLGVHLDLRPIGHDVLHRKFVDKCHSCFWFQSNMNSPLILTIVNHCHKDIQKEACFFLSIVNLGYKNCLIKLLERLSRKMMNNVH